MTDQTARELYEFIASDGRPWRYTSADHQYEYLGETYLPIAIGRGEIEHGTDVSRDPLNITVPRDNPLGLLVARGQLDAVVAVTIYDLEDEDDPMVIWSGRIASARGRRAEISIECESILTALNRNGLNPRWLRLCPHALYRRGCNLDPEDWAVAGTVAAVDGATVTVTEAGIEPDNWYFGGMIRFGDVYRLIVGHTGTELRLFGEIPGLEATDAVSIYPGCDHTPEKCAGTFNNLDNFGGKPWIPLRNPMGGSSIL